MSKGILWWLFTFNLEPAIFLKFKLKMIDTYIHMVVTNCRYISNYCPEKMLDVDLMCPVGIEKTKMKAM